MNMMDHYPTKKRRLMLNSKTPTRTGKSDSTHITSKLQYTDLKRHP